MEIPLHEWVNKDIPNIGQAWVHDLSLSQKRSVINVSLLEDMIPRFLFSCKAAAVNIHVPKETRPLFSLFFL